MDENKVIGCLTVIIVFVIFIGTVGCSILKLFSGIPIEYSKGEKTGVVFKVTQGTGYYFKTNECEMNLGGMIKTDDKMVVNTWSFSVTDASMLEKLIDYSKNGDVVTVKYTQPWLMPWRTGSSGYLALDVQKKEVEKKKLKKKKIVEVEEDDTE